MSIAFPEVRVGGPVRHENLAVFPLFAPPGSEVDYQLSHEALGANLVTVSEVSEAGSVPDLLVENKGDVRVLFLEGEELVGAKQNRVLNCTVLVAAHTRTRLPVSCVEAGRWGYRSRRFGSSSNYSSSSLRHVLRGSVTASLTSGRGRRSDQHAVWEEVSRQQKALGARSPTSAMSDTYAAYRERLDESRERLKYVDGAVGVAVALADRVVAVDVFDKPATCGRVWDRLLSGAVLDALEAGPADKAAERADVERFVTTLAALPWKPTDPVGEGREYRAKSQTGDCASVVVLDGTLVHGSLVCAT